MISDHGHCRRQERATPQRRRRWWPAPDQRQQRGL